MFILHTRKLSAPRSEPDPGYETSQWASQSKQNNHTTTNCVEITSFLHLQFEKQTQINPSFSFCSPLTVSPILTWVTACCICLIWQRSLSHSKHNKNGSNTEKACLTLCFEHRLSGYFRVLAATVQEWWENSSLRLPYFFLYLAV